MMTPQEHKERAEFYMEQHSILVRAGRSDTDSARDKLVAAQVHANLASVPESKAKDTPEAERHWQSAMDMQRQRDDALDLLRDETKTAQRTRPSSGGNL